MQFADSTYKAVLVKGGQEAAVAILELCGQLDEFGDVIPLVVLEHATGQYLLDRRSMSNIYIYKLVGDEDVQVSS